MSRKLLWKYINSTLKSFRKDLTSPPESWAYGVDFRADGPDAG
jgi:hypothetical protein